MFKRKKTIHDLKREHLKIVTDTLGALRRKEIHSPEEAHNYTPPKSIEPTFLIEISLYDLKYNKEEETHRKGYALRVDPTTMEISSGSFFRQDGYATYEEAELKAEDIQSIRKYFSIPTISQIVYGKIKEILARKNPLQNLDTKELPNGNLFPEN